MTHVLQQGHTQSNKVILSNSDMLYEIMRAIYNQTTNSSPWTQELAKNIIIQDAFSLTPKVSVVYHSLNNVLKSKVQILP